jgi:uncharacterized membrane protein YeaQ/YmgE (transglycosylase-associated protein family)
MSLFVWIVLGMAAGWLASHLMRDSGYGQNGEIVLGILGAVGGGILAGLWFKVNVVSGFNLETLIVAFAAALAVIIASRAVKYSRREA